MRLTSILLTSLLAGALGACSSSPAPNPTITIGNTATPVPTVDADLRILDMQLVEPDVGWVLLADRRLLWTEDGGDTWSDVPLPKAVQGESYRVHFLDSAHGWLSHVRAGAQGLDSPSSVEIYRTSDGAEHWQKSNLEDSSTSFIGVFRFVDPKNGWFDGTIRGLTLTSPVLFRTSDGGATWIHLPGAALPRVGFGHDSTFVTPMDGWVTEIDGGLFRTRDGGVTWQSVQLPFPTECEERGAHYFIPAVFTNPVEGVVQVRQHCSGEAGTSFYTTEDGGDSWQFATFRAAAYNTYVIAPDRWLDERDDIVFSTTTRGKDWTDVTEDWAPVVQPCDTEDCSLTPVTALQFADAENGWVRVQGTQGLFATVDGGHSWDLLLPK